MKALDDRLERDSVAVRRHILEMSTRPVAAIRTRAARRRVAAAAAAFAVVLGGFGAITLFLTGGSDGSVATQSADPNEQSVIPEPVGDATFLEWSVQNGRLGREGILEVRLNADEDRPELVGVRLLLYPTLQSNGAYKYQVRIDGTGDICGFLEGLFEIDGNTGQFLNDVFPDPDEMNVGASRPYFPYICEPDPQPGTIDAVLVAPFDLLLEPGVLTMSNSGGTVRFVVSND